MLATNNPEDVLRYLMIDKNIYEKLAQQSANAIQGLNPTITQHNWVTDGNAGGPGQDPIADLMKRIPPLIDTIHKQTGIRPPDWLVNSDGLISAGNKKKD